MNTSAVTFASSPRTIIIRKSGKLHNLGTFANYFLAEPVARAAAKLAGVTQVEMLTHILPA
jgi:hypothetical protein